MIIIFPSLSWRVLPLMVCEFYFFKPVKHCKTGSNIILYFYYFFRLFFKILIYFWLHWVFVAACQFSLVVVRGAVLCCGARASHCSGFSCCGARTLGTWTSVVVAHGLGCSVACGIFLDQVSNPCPLHWQVDS